jgi:hypothetical protein
MFFKETASTAYPAYSGGAGGDSGGAGGDSAYFASIDSAPGCGCSLSDDPSLNYSSALAEQRICSVAQKWAKF